MSRLVDYIVDLGLGAGMDRIKKWKDTQQIKERMREYVERHEKINELSLLTEEIDFEDLAKYLSTDFLLDMEKYLFGIGDGCERVKEVIFAKADSYSNARNIQSKEKVRQLIRGSIEILRAFYLNSLNDNEKLQVAEIARVCNQQVQNEGEKIISTIEEARAESNEKLDAIKESIKQEGLNSSVMEDTYAAEGDVYYQFTRRPNEKCTVENMFLSGIYSFFSINDALDDEIENEEEMDNKEALFNKTFNTLQQQRVLLIAGDYGSGKTIFLKAFHQLIYRMENVVVFTSFCRHIIPFIQKESREGLYSFLESLHEDGKKHYILLDGLDDLNVPLSDSESYLEQCISWLMDYFKQKEDYYLLITSRNYIDMGRNHGEKIQEYMAYYYTICFKEDNFQFIKTREFNLQEIETWIEQYARIHGLYANKTTVKQDYKRIIKSLANPLFIYIFMERYKKNGFNAEEKYYCYYQEFVKQTIEGKYYFEVSNGAYVLQENDFVSQYQELLEYVSFDILQHNNEIIELGDEIWKEEILLGERLLNRNYYLWMRQFSEVTEKKMDGMYKKGMKEANLLNCYFIAKEGDFIFFRDINILFLLAANRVYKSLWEVIQRKDCVFSDEDMKDIQAISFYPQLLDFVLYQIVKDGRRDAFWRYTYDAISKEAVTGKLLLFQKEKSDVVSKILLLYIIFIKLNDKSYQMVELRHFMKDMNHYNKLYKEVKYQKKSPDKYIYSVERYFMGVNLSGATINRLNLKFYNFQGASLSDVVFYQCRFYDNNFKNINLKKLTFKLCSMQKLDLINGKKENQSILCMENCQLNQCRLTGVRRMEIKGSRLDDVTLNISAHEEFELEECNIYVLHIKSEDGKNTGKIKFSNCVFNSQISLTEMKGKIEVSKKCVKNFEGKLFVNCRNVDIEGADKIC